MTSCFYETFGEWVGRKGHETVKMVEFFLDFSQKKVVNTKIYTKIYNLLATGRKASGQYLFQGCHP